MNKVIIKDIKLHKIEIPLKEPFVISLGPVYAANNVIVSIHTSIGIIGWGECSPFMSINGESADTAMVVGNYFKELWVGKEALNIKDRIKELNALIYGNNSIKSAFDMALYDVASQNAGLPLYQYLKGKKNKVIYTDYTVSVGEPKKMAADALKIKQDGYTVIKVKIGKGGKKDIARIKAIRDVVGNEIPIRVDANQGWAFNEAIETLNELSQYNIQHCEEPLPRWAYMQLPKLKQKSPIPIMCDETCCDANDVQRLIDLKACDLINIKLGKSGGIFNALKMVRLAEAAGIKIQIGAFLESRLAMTAFAHFALCSDNIIYYDFDTSLMLSSDPIEGGLHYKENGLIKLPEVPGIGAALK